MGSNIYKTSTYNRNLRVPDTIYKALGKGNGVEPNIYQPLRLLSKRKDPTPPRTPRISRLKSQIMKPTFLS